MADEYSWLPLIDDDGTEDYSDLPEINSGDGSDEYANLPLVDAPHVGFDTPKPTPAPKLEYKPVERASLFEPGVGEIAAPLIGLDQEEGSYGDESQAKAMRREQEKAEENRTRELVWEGTRAFSRSAPEGSILLNEMLRKALPESAAEEYLETPGIPEAEGMMLWGTKGQTEGFKKGLEGAEFQHPEDFRMPEGIWETFLFTIPQVVGQAAATAIGGQATGALMMFGQIAGGQYNQLLKEGVSEDRAMAMSIVNGLLQAPLEQIGMKGITKAWMPKIGLLKRMKNVLKHAGTEGLTEFLQKYPEEITTMIARNPGHPLADLGKEVLNNMWDWTKEGLSMDMPVGMLMGAFMGSPGLVTRAGAFDPDTMPKRKGSDDRSTLAKVGDWLKENYNVEAQFEPQIPFTTPEEQDIQVKKTKAPGAKETEFGGRETEPLRRKPEDVVEKAKTATKLAYKPAKKDEAFVRVTEAAQKAIQKRKVDKVFMDALAETIEDIAPTKVSRVEGVKTPQPQKLVTPQMVEEAEQKARARRIAEEIKKKGTSYEGEPLVDSKTGLPFKTEAQAQVAITRFKQENPRYKNWEWEVVPAKVNVNKGFGLKPVRPMKRTAAIVRNALRKDPNAKIGDVYRSVKGKAPEERATRQDVAKLVKQHHVDVPSSTEALEAEYKKLGKQEFQHNFNPLNLEAGLIKKLTDAGVARGEAKKRVRASLNRYSKLYNKVLAEQKKIEAKTPKKPKEKPAEKAPEKPVVPAKKKKTTRVEKRKQRQERSNRSREIRKNLRENPKPWAEMSKEELVETSSMLLEESGMTKLPVYKGKQFGKWSKQDHIGWLEETGAFDYTAKAPEKPVVPAKKKKPILGEGVKVQTEEGLGKIVRAAGKGQWDVQILEGEDKGEIFPYGSEELKAPGEVFPAKKEAQPETQQLDLFPNMQQAIDEAEKAIDDLNKTIVKSTPEGDIITHGVGITVRIKTGKALDIRGYKIKNHADAANVFQVFRDPRFESSRTIYLRKGVVVHQEGVTVGMPSVTPTWIKNNLANQAKHFNEMLTKYKADQIIVVHNHPSGQPDASDADISAMEKTLKVVKQMGYQNVWDALQYEIIIDSGKYGIVERSASGKLTHKVEALKGLPKNWQDPLMQPSLPSKGLLRIAHKNRAAGIARSMSLGDGTVAVMFLDSDLNIRVIQELPRKLFDRWNQKKLQRYLNKVAFDHGATSTYLYTNKYNDNVWNMTPDLMREGYIHEYFYDSPSSTTKVPRLVSARDEYRSIYETARSLGKRYGQTYQTTAKVVLKDITSEQMDSFSEEPMNAEMVEASVVDTRKALDFSTVQTRILSDELGVGITTKTSDGKYARGKAGRQDTAKTVAKNLKDDIIVESWDGFTSVQEAYEYARDSMVFLDPVIVEDRKGVRWQINKNGHYGNDKMAFPNLTYPKGRNTYDFQGCGRKAFFEANNLLNLWHPNGYVGDKACYGGACYAEAIIKGNGGANATIAGGIMVQGTTKAVKEHREEVARYVARHGVIAARKKYPNFQINWFGDSFKVQKQNPKTKKFRTTRKFDSEEEARAYLNGRSGGEYRIDVEKGKGTTIGEIVQLPGPARVTTLLGPAKGQDIRLGVDTDGGAWIVYPEVMDALLKTGAKKFSIYSSAYHQVPPKHKLSEKSIINVTISGYHPLPETFKRLEWAKAARANGWTVILREVTADPNVFTKAEVNLYNRIHEALLKTDFLIMEQPLHKGKAKSKPGESAFGLPGCCKGSKANPNTCDQCEVAEGQGQKFQKFWGMKEGSLAAGKLIPDTAEFEAVKKQPEISDEAEVKTFKNYAGTKIARFKNNVGKMVSGKLYAHKNYAKELFPKKALAAAEKVVKKEFPNHKYNVVVHEQKTGKFWFHNSPDFDIKPEPTSGEYVVVDGKTTKRAKTSTIWHHKWQWVKDDYKGFDVDESFERSKDWAMTEYNASKIGTPANWDKWLTDNNLPPNVAKAEFDTTLAQGTARGAAKKGAVGIKAVVPKTVVYLGKLKPGMKVLDFGAGKGRPHADQVEKATGATVNAYDFSLEGSEAFLTEDGYDLIYASNVLNTQKVKDDPTSPRFLEFTTNQFLELLDRNPGAEIIANFPSEPRHTPSIKNKGKAMQTAEMTEWLDKHFTVRKLERWEQQEAGIKSASDIYVLAKKGELVSREEAVGDEPRIDRTIDDVFGAEPTTFRKRIKRLFKFLRNWKTHLVDKYHPIRLALGEEAYKQHRMIAGLDSLYTAFMEDGDFIIDDNGNITVDRTTESVGDFMKNNPEVNDMLMWAALQRAKRLEQEVVRKGKKKGLAKERWLVGENREAVEKHLDEQGKSDEFYQELYDKFLVHHKSLLNVMMHNGLINQQQYDRWTEEIYVPFHRVFQTEQGDETSKHPYSTDAIGSKLKELEGAEMKLGDPLENVLANWAYMLKETLRNGATVHALNTALNIQAEEGGLIVTVEKEGGKDTIAFMKDGRRAYFKVHDIDLFNALKSVNAEGIAGWWDFVFGKPKRLLTYTITKTPAFVLANTTRDTLSTAIIEKDFIPFWDSLKGIYHIMTNSDEYIRAKAAGALFGGSYTRADNPRGAAKLAKRFTPKKGKGIILDTPAKMWAMYEKFIDASENAARVGLFIKKTRKGATDFEAAYRARDITDFANHGASEPVKYLLSTMPFLGARMQGNYKLYRAFKENTAAFMLKGMGLALASMALWSLYADDERYQELEDWDKWTYHHFWVGGEHFKIPKGFEVGVIFSSAFETAANVAFGHEELTFLKRFIYHSFTQTFALDIPQVIKPVAEVWANKSFFTGRPIESAALKNLEPGERAAGYDSETLRWLGRGLNLSPKKMQSLVRGYVGGLGGSILTGVDQVTRWFGDFPERPTVTTADYPVLGRFWKEGPARNTKHMTRFYEALEESNRLVATIKHYRELGDYDKAMELREENIRKIRLNRRLRTYQKQLSKIRKRTNQVYLNRTLSPDEKRAALDRLTERRNRIAERAYDIYTAT